MNTIVIIVITMTRIMIAIMMIMIAMTSIMMKTHLKRPETTEGERSSTNTLYASPPCLRIMMMIMMTMMMIIIRIKVRTATMMIDNIPVCFSTLSESAILLSKRFGKVWNFFLLQN